jgi:hypothetical protein
VDELYVAGISVVTTLATTFVRDWWVRKYSRGDEREKQLAERLHRERNVWRVQEDDSVRGIVRMTKIEWYVNPFWVSQVEGRLVIREWEEMQLQDVTFEVGENKVAIDKRVPMRMEKAIRARSRKEWLVFTEWDGVLTFYHTAPVTAEDSFLFQELPTREKGRRRV